MNVGVLENVKLSNNPVPASSRIKEIKINSPDRNKNTDNTEYYIFDGGSNVASIIRGFRAVIVEETLNNKTDSWLIIDYHIANRTWSHDWDQSIFVSLRAGSVNTPGGEFNWGAGRRGCHYGGGLQVHKEFKFDPQYFDLIDLAWVTFDVVSGVQGEC